MSHKEIAKGRYDIHGQPIDIDNEYEELQGRRGDGSPEGYIHGNSRYGADRYGNDRYGTDRYGSNRDKYGNDRDGYENERDRYANEDQHGDKNVLGVRDGKDDDEDSEKRDSGCYKPDNNLSRLRLI